MNLDLLRVIIIAISLIGIGPQVGTSYAQLDTFENEDLENEQLEDGSFDKPVKKKRYKKKRYKKKRYKKKRYKRASKPKDFEAAAGLGIPSLVTPTYGLMTSFRAYGHYSVTVDYGSGSFDTSSFADEKSAAQIDHSFTGFGAYYYPSETGSFYFGAQISIEEISVNSVAHADLVDFDAATETEFEINQTTVISSTFLTPALGFKNGMFKYFYSDFRFGLAVPISSESSYTADREAAPGLDDERFDEATLQEKADIENIFGGVLPYLSAGFGVKIDF